jgi:hypothetical protein
MQSKVQSVVNKFKKYRELDILVNTKRQLYLNSLSYTNQNFYHLNGQWDYYLSTHPNNVVSYFGNSSAIFDCIIDTENSLEMNSLANGLNIPVIRPVFNFGEVLPSNYYIFNDESQQQFFKLENSSIIEIAADNKLFNKKQIEKQPRMFTCINQWRTKNKECNFVECMNLARTLPNFEIYGDNDFSPRISFDVLANLYNSHVYFNPVSIGTTSMGIAQALASGCFIITCDYSGVDEVINYTNGIVIESLSELPEIAANLDKYRKDYEPVCNIEQFSNKWKMILEQVCSRNFNIL